ncbi:hypothetical protein ACIJDA_002632 [Enterococcus faecalis]|uniref:Uncharacterized protein n=1 Tax=Enterococcus faecalis TaxID=1351 RepID=A0A1W6QXQ3_ENTFL|nr:hypothetical protein [Enterococcus faecalis]ARO46266.1 hypothetical protein [Enterococcus faecalis]MDN3126032.1 hypothetical protein [Enterococcus faecalis]HAP3834222.1 hypothetical protein [Enterococcus faecalis]
MKQPKEFRVFIACFFVVFLLIGMVSLFFRNEGKGDVEEYVLSSTMKEDASTINRSSESMETSSSSVEKEPSKRAVDQANWNASSLDTISKLEALGTQFIVSLMNPDVKKDSAIKAITSESVQKQLASGQIPLYQFIQNIEKEEVVHYGTKEQLIYSFMSVDKQNRGVLMTGKLLFGQSGNDWKIEEVSFEEKR